MILITFFILAVLALALYAATTFYKTFNNWKWKRVKYIKPLPVFGNMLPVITARKSLTELLEHLYWKYPEERYCGIFHFTTPVLLIRDPELLKTITVKHFDNFADHQGFISPEADPVWGSNLFSTEGERWHEIRQLLSPLFTSSKMKSMFVMMDECARNFVQFFLEQNQEIIESEMKDIFSRYGNDVIVKTTFGITCDSLKDQNNDFFLMGKELTDFTGLKMFKFLAYNHITFFVKLFDLKIVNYKVKNFFKNLLDESIRLREEKNIIRADLINLLMKVKKDRIKQERKIDFSTSEEEPGTTESTKIIKNPLTDDESLAQALVFFFGGFDTSSTSLSFAAYELAIHPDIQDRLRKEISKCDGKITYETLHNMKYLDMVISETLRLWPQAVYVDRKCTKPFTIKPEKAGEVPVYMKVGDFCWLPYGAIHKDPNYYPNPSKFDPERFNDENKAKIKSFTYNPFGSGPRNCIGSRFALMETKILLYHILKNFEIVPTKKTEIPLPILKSSFLVMAKNGNWLGFKKITTT